MGYIVGGVIAGIVVLGIILWRPWRRHAYRARLARAQRAFRDQRKELEAAFFGKAAASGKPRGLRWKQCDFDEAVTMAREPGRSALAAFVGVTISFEAIEGGPMEEVEAVGNLRAGTAIFTYTRDGWQTDGRAVLNLDPAEAIERYAGELEVVTEVASHAP